MRRQTLINLALDNVIGQTTDAIGTQGTIANRLNQSINADGSLKLVAIDNVLHDIGSHTDSSTYVRMTRAESDKLGLIADGATNLTVAIQLDELGNNVVVLDGGPIQFIPSPSVAWVLEAPNKLVANLNFPVEAAHKHYYDQTPVPANLIHPDYTNYQVNSLSSAFMNGSLRVYINGVRLSATEAIYIPGALVNDPWTLLTYSASAANGTFALSAAISVEDIIRIDYDISFI